MGIYHRCYILMIVIILALIMAGSSHKDHSGPPGSYDYHEIIEPDPLDHMVPSGEKNFDELKQELQETYIKIMEIETRKILLETLINENLATRDIFFFIKKQAELRVVDKQLDEDTMKLAMRQKIKDLRKALKIQKAKALTLEQLLRDVLGNNRRKYRRQKSEMKIKVSKMRRNKWLAYRRKIKHYRNIQQRAEPRRFYTVEEGYGEKNNKKDKKKHDMPRNLDIYSDLSVFNGPDGLPKRQEPLGPFICDKSIILSPEEILILKKSPKFSIMSEVDEKDYKIETEKMLCKHRYSFKKEKKKLYDHIETLEGKDMNKNLKKRKQDRKEEISKIWTDTKDRYVYNPVNRSVSFLKRKPTDYKLNKYTHLPKPLDFETEFQCEVRRRKYQSVLDGYKRGLLDNGKKKRDTDKDLNITLRGKKKKKDTELNLNKKERGTCIFKEEDTGR